MAQSTLTTLHVKNRKFSIDNLESVLREQKSGKYHVIWYTNTDSWDIFLRWNGTEYTDLVKS